MQIWVKIRQLKNEGKSKKKIARLLGISKNTVKKYLSQEAPPQYNHTSKRASQWDVYETEIKQSLDKLLPSVIYENLRSKGATGSRTGFYNYIKTLQKGLKEYNLSMRFETLPGDQAQFDWAEYMIDYKKTGKKKVYILSIILGYSRYRLTVASEDVKQLSLFQSLELGFQYFGGVPKQLLIDNPRQFIDNAKPKEFKINKTFEEFAAYYNFSIHACKVRHPQTKGKIENPFKYLENHFIKNNEFTDFLDLSNKLSSFTEKVNNKYHAGLGDIPKKIFQEKEQKTLQSLPKQNYFEAFNKELRKVNHAGTINFKNVSYSVPILYSYQQVRIEPVLGYKLNIYSLQGVKIAEHLISSQKGGLVTKNEHYEPFLKKSRQDFSQVKLDFIQLFPKEKEFIKKLEASRKTHYLSDLSRILKLCQYYELSDLEASFRCCEQYQSYKYDMVHSYLKTNCTPKEISSVIQDSVSLEEIYLSTETRNLNYYDNIRS